MRPCFHRMTTSVSTMADVETAICHHRDAFNQHPFLVRLEQGNDKDQLLRLLPRIAFFALTFQDMLRLARERCTDQRLAGVARTLELDDEGHDAWYLADLERLRIPVSAGSIFSKDNAVTRDVSYALLSEVINLTDDKARVAVMLSLELIAREFFVRVSGFAERSGLGADLRYFGRRHLEAEEAHRAFGTELKETWTTIEVADDAIFEVLRSVERTFELMARLADDLDVAMATASTSP